jgi:predicted metal-dependent peptidase
MKGSVFDRAKATIVMDHPFFSSILFNYPLIETKTLTKTLAVSDRGRIFYNPDFCERLNVGQLVYGLCHEALHVVGLHPQRLQNRDAERWNIAADAWVNDTLDDARVGERIPNTVCMPGAKDKSVDQIYNELPVRKGKGTGECEGNTGTKEGGGNGSPPPPKPEPDEDDEDDGEGPGGDGDEDDEDEGEEQGGGGEFRNDGANDSLAGDLIKEGPGLTPSELSEMEANAKVIVAKAAQVAKARGRMPAALQRMVDELIESKVPWYDIFHRWMVAYVKADYSWTRPNRRYIGQGVYLPSTGVEPSMGTLVVQKDLSGSVSKEESRHFDGHLARIIEDCRPEKVYVLYTDSRVAKVDEFGPDDEVEFGYWSGGGTDMDAGIRWCEENGIEPDVFVTMTDGETGYRSEPPPFPTIWVISRKEYTAPFGDTVHFEMESV